MHPQPHPPTRWEADLSDFFATVGREDETYLANLKRQGTFYADTARPALETAAAALRQHQRVCEVGVNQNRVYLIVRRSEGTVEFQYAVMVEVRIEALTPYVHCWFEEDEYLGKPDAGKPQPAHPEEPEGEKPAGDEGGEPEDKEKEKDDKQPARTKTVEVLGTWADGRTLESVTPEELLADFTAHYKEAVTRLRTHLHTTPQ